MALECIIKRMVIGLKDIGRMIFSMGRPRRSEAMELSLKGRMLMEKGMVWERWYGVMGLHTWENVIITREAAVGLTPGQMDGGIKGNGLTLKCVAWVFIVGLMVEAMSENIRLIRNMDSEFTTGQTEESSLDTGKMASNMDSGFTRPLQRPMRVKLSNLTMNYTMVSGKMENIYYGSMP